MLEGTISSVSLFSEQRRWESDRCDGVLPSATSSRICHRVLSARAIYRDEPATILIEDIHKAAGSRVSEVRTTRNPSSNCSASWRFRARGMLRIIVPHL